jgi:hypothetical protein
MPKPTPTSGLVFGRVKHPPFDDRLIPDAQNYAWDNLGQRKALGVAQHTMVGTLMGTDAWFRRGAASNGLTDYGIGDVSDGAANDGRILRWNDPLGRPHPGVSPNRWGWASGPCNGMEGDGPAFVKKYGANAVNGYLVSIERSDGGNPERPPSDKYLESFCLLTAYWADQAKVPWDSFPLNPVNGLTFYYGHYEFSTKSCAGYAVRAREPDVVERVRALLKADQVTTTAPPPVGEEDPLADLPKSDHVLDVDLIWPNASTGSVGQLWRDYGEATGSWGEPSQPWNDTQSDGSKLYVFTNGLTIATKGGEAGIVVKAK